MFTHSRHLFDDHVQSIQDDLVESRLTVMMNNHDITSHFTNESDARRTTSEHFATIGGQKH
jgi:hypothetical protein